MDQISTPMALSDSSGNVVWSVEMDAFGNATVNEDPDGDGISITQPWRFPGQYYDAETGWYYNRYRYYLAGEGIYNRIDPARSGHLYAYAGGNPVNLFDYFGLRALTQLELTEAKKIFGNTIDYSKVDINSEASGRAGTRMNEIMLTKFDYKKLSDAKCVNNNNIDSFSILIHELTHVWQWQAGQKFKKTTEHIFAWLRESLLPENWGDPKAHYKEKIDESKDIYSYNVETQANIAESIYLIINEAPSELWIISTLPQYDYLFNSEVVRDKYLSQLHKVKE